MKSNLDVWAIQSNKDETREALRKVDKDYEGNILYLNCLCSFKIGKERITDKVFDACFYSEESDVVILFAKDMISEEEIEQYLKEFDIKYTIIRFTKIGNSISKNKMSEVWFAREKCVLEDAIIDSINKDINVCDYYPDMQSKIILGYLTRKNNFCEIEGRFCEGVIVFKDKIILLVNQRDPRNLSQFEVRNILDGKGIKYKIKTNKVVKRK